METVKIADFDKLELAMLFELDTSKCFTGKKKIKFNKYCIYNIFAGYCDLDRFRLKDMINTESKKISYGTQRYQTCAWAGKTPTWKAG